MEKFCTIAIFLGLGLSVFVRGLIFLESDANLNTDKSDKNDPVFPVFENQDDYHDYPLENRLGAESPVLVRTTSSNIEGNSDSNTEKNLPDFENRDDYPNYPLENLISGGHEMIESNPVVEEIPKDIELIYQMNKKRHVPDRGFTVETKKQMLDLHNLYRGNVTPPAGNMNFLEWDDQLEHLAQLWADNCKFEHGRPPHTSYSYGGKVLPYGQNLYLGTDPSGYKGLWMWYEEYMHYELRNQTCKPNEQCGHYVQMAWAESKRLGCGIKACGMRYLIVCHYYPGAIRNTQMFKVGRPCSLCNIDDGTLCKDKLCVPNELCAKKPKICDSAKCNLKCQNCGLLNKTTCQCTCADGWDALDCSIPCADEHERCGIKPGFPHQGSCSLQSYTVAKKYCRKMCGTCATVTTDDTSDHHLCCEGRLCEKGYVLDLERKPCRCTMLCPGPQCDFIDDDSSAEMTIHLHNFIFLISQILALIFTNHGILLL